MAWIDQHIGDILASLGLGTGGGLLGWLAGRRRDSAEVKSIEVTTLQSTITALQDVNRTLRDNINELQSDIKEMKNEFILKCQMMEQEIQSIKSKMK